MAGIGLWTASDLSEPQRLFIPAADDILLPEGERRKGGVPVFSRQAARLSLELSATAYSFEIDPWADAGWEDFSFQIDHTLISGEKINPLEGGLWHSAVREWMQYLARSRVQRRNPITQLRGIRRQQQSGSADTCKALVMSHEMGGRVAVAVGFMGTGRRLADWASNFRMKPEEGLHQGFLQLTREFLDNMPRITFPKTARQLGLSSLTLADIAEEMKRPDSRFVLWASGHSQGGAIMQVFFDALLRQGVLPQHLCGIGFASPSVADGNRVSGFIDYPMVHIINADDVTPRVGALSHLGACYVFTPDDDIRALFYRTMWEDDCFRETMAFAARQRDTKQALLFGASLLSVLAELPAEELRPLLHGTINRAVPEKMLGVVDEKLDAGLRFLNRRTAMAYRDFAGAEIPQDQLTLYIAYHRDLFARYGNKRYIRCLLSALALPHKLAVEDDGKRSVAPYLYIAKRGFEELKYESRVSAAAPMWSQPRAHTKPKKRRPPQSRFSGLTSLKNLRK